MKMAKRIKDYRKAYMNLQQKFRNQHKTINRLYLENYNLKADILMFKQRLEALMANITMSKDDLMKSKIPAVRKER